MSHTIDVTVEGKNITVNPSRLYLEQSPENQEVIWDPGTGVTITNIVFQGSSPPITPRSGQGGRWGGSFDANAEFRSYKYTITLQDLSPLDPEIEYGPGTVDLGEEY